MNVREALWKVRDDLLSGAIPDESFDMGFSWCDSTGCIGGWVGKYIGLDVESDGFTCHDVLEQYKKEGGDRDVLHWLFYPREGIGAYFATPREGAKAIDNFLNSKSYPWEGVCKTFS